MKSLWSRIFRRFWHKHEEKHHKTSTSPRYYMTSETPMKTKTTICFENSKEDYSDFQVRLASFKNWPNSHPIKPYDLAHAGHVYFNYDDHTICFDCKREYRQWDESHSPYEKHKSGCSTWSKSFSIYRTVQFRKKMPKNVSLKMKDVSRKSYRQLLEENRPLKKPKLCKLCEEKERCIIYMPCEHFISCVACSKLYKTCFVCMRTVLKTKRIYFEINNS